MPWGGADRIIEITCPVNAVCLYHPITIHPSSPGWGNHLTYKPVPGANKVESRGGFPGGSEGKASAWSLGDSGSIPESGRSPREGSGNPLQHSCLKNPMDGGAWWAAVHGVAQSCPRLSSFTWGFPLKPFPGLKQTPSYSLPCLLLHPLTPVSLTSFSVLTPLSALQSSWLLLALPHGTHSSVVRWLHLLFTFLKFSSAVYFHGLLISFKSWLMITFSIRLLWSLCLNCTCCPKSLFTAVFFL